jgi:hypothetical protein
LVFLLVAIWQIISAHLLAEARGEIPDATTEHEVHQEYHDPLLG